MSTGKLSFKCYNCFSLIQKPASNRSCGIVGYPIEDLGWLGRYSLKSVRTDLVVKKIGNRKKKLYGTKYASFLNILTITGKRRRSLREIIVQWLVHCLLPVTETRFIRSKCFDLYSTVSQIIPPQDYQMLFKKFYPHPKPINIKDPKKLINFLFELFLRTHPFFFFVKNKYNILSTYIWKHYRMTSLVGKPRK